MIRPLIVILILSSSAWGADAHCSLDTDRNGTVDSWCDTHADADRDGFTVAEGDCDDNDPFVWPGSPLDVNGCSAGQWRQCAGDGSGWTSCTSSGYLAEATGSGSNYFVDPVSGNDSTGDGSQGNPLASFAMLGHYNFDPGPPVGYIGLVRGDVVYVKNGTVGTYSSNYGAAGDPIALAMRGPGASGTTPIIVRNFPGERPILNGRIYNEGTPYLYLRGFNVTPGAKTQGVKLIAGADNSRIDNVKIFDTDGSQGDNLAGIEIHTSDDVVVQSSEIYDSYDRGNVGSLSENNSGIVMFQVNNPLLRGVKVVNANQRSNCIKLKHQNSLGALGPPVIDTATCWNTGVAGTTTYVFGFGGSAIVRDSLARGHSAKTKFVQQRDFGGPTYFDDPSIFEDNTCLVCDIELLPAGDDSGIDTTVFRRNIITDTSADGYVINLLDRGSDGCFTDIVTGGKYTWTNNCYHTPSKTFNTSVFGSTATPAEHCTETPTTTASGAYYASFAAWTGAGFDSGSFNKDPDLSSESLAQDADCSEFGIAASMASPPTAAGGVLPWLQ